MASTKIEKILEPTTQLENRSQLNETVRRIAVLQRKLDKADDTLERRKRKASKKHEDATKPILADLNPLLDQAFWYVYTHWNDLLTGRATESVKLSDATFKRHIDNIGTLLINKQIAAEYLRTIDTSDFAKKLRHAIGDEKAEAQLQQLKGLISTNTVIDVDTEKLKAFLMTAEAPIIEGASVQFTNTLKLIPAQSPSQQARGKKPTMSIREIP